MAGKNCVGICSDLRLGIQAQTVAKDFENGQQFIEEKSICSFGGYNFIELNEKIKICLDKKKVLLKR